MSNNKPVIQEKNGKGLSVSVFANATAEGKTYYNTPGVENRYYDKKTEEWKSTSRLSESEMIEAADLLRDAARAIRKHRVANAAASNDPAHPAQQVG